ncbi:ligase-associated DNA damage response endonuclease PdeM [Pelagibacterium montanilacus]|uniref:ligase-associated DNA damage response endonuclease PdeM n=1 Tax=Pelagibacterium montanilacus TaxID=2185280 RepID=UPI000F8D0F7C|nr:ligase-associated DNA damage response endonuclease PdeM [Pelagibacterium montanilacus]
MSATTAPHPGHSLVFTFRGQSFLPLISGALYWPSRETLIVADLHLGKFASFARAGQLLPPYDTTTTLHALERDLEVTGARAVLSLGDSFHRDESLAMLTERDVRHLESLARRVRWTWIAGNHDPKPHRLGGTCCAEIGIETLSFRHEPRAGADGHVAGHLHPAARVAMNGKATRRPCFVWDDNLMVLPAYGASTGSLNILSPAFAGLFDRASRKVMVIGRDQVYPVGANRLVNG